MALLDEKIIVNDVPERSGFDPIPAGKYDVMITGSEIKNTKAGDGKILVLQFEIQGAKYEGRKLFENLNIRNPNSVAQDIARQQLAELLRALGKESLTDTEELHGKRVSIQLNVEVQKATTAYPNPQPRNVIKKYMSLNSTGTQQPASGDAASGESMPRWKRQS